MRIRRLHLKAFGPFTNRILDFGVSGHGLVVVHGVNETGKSSALRAISDLLFGIPQQSRDNFVHTHADIRLGGEFEDVGGAHYSFMRRKGRNPTLFFADFALYESTLDRSVPPAIEALLGHGLTKDAYDSMFGLDHRRLREGGEALLKGEGDVGAALFEASAGVRSIPTILEKLDASARKFYVPGARGKNARINEGLSTFDARHDEYRKAQIRPAQWTQLFKQQQEAEAALSQLESRRRETGDALALTKELRAVIPLLASLDSATQTLEELEGAVLLQPTAEMERIAAEAGLLDAETNAQTATTEFAKQNDRLAKLVPDATLLSLAPAIRRLAAAAEALDQHRRDVADATIEASRAADRVSEVARQIAANSTVEEVIKQAPTPTSRTVIERQLRRIESAALELETHRKSAPPEQVQAIEAVPDLPSSESRVGLAVARQEVDRSANELKRLATLPGEIRSAERQAAQMLDTLGLADESAVSRARPVLDADIDAGLKEQNEISTSRAALEQRIADINTGLSEIARTRDRLLSSGAVPTREDVEMARAQRDSVWTNIRRHYIEETAPPSTADGESAPLPESYERSVQRADELVDAFASEQERAAQLQAANVNIRALEHDRTAIADQVQVLAQRDLNRLTSWHVRLESAGLPRLPPAALRDWQSRLSKIREILEGLKQKRDELDDVRTIALGLADRLREAIAATGLADPSEQAQLGTLSATAVEVANTIQQREISLQRSGAQAGERDRQKRHWTEREAALKAELESAQSDAGSLFSALLLRDDTEVSVGRSRLAEFDTLLSGHARQLAAKDKLSGAEKKLEVLVTDAEGIRSAVGDPAIADLRLFVDGVSTRLAAAEDVQHRRQLALQAADTAAGARETHEATAARHRKKLEELCRVAAVDSLSMLPGAEDRSNRKRRARETVSASRGQLKQASRRRIEELRTLISGRAAPQLDADEDTYSKEQEAVNGALPNAREHAAQAKRELDTIDSSDTAAAAREGMEEAAAAVRNSLPNWIRSKIAHALLAEALRRFRDRAQGPMLLAASHYFGRMTRNAYTRLLSDDSEKEPLLIAERKGGSKIRVEEMSEGTRDQLYLALRLAALDIRREAGVDLPFVLDDVLMTSDEDRAAAALESLADFGRRNQVIVFTHHRHVADLAGQGLASEPITVVEL